jgi:hypothetical protein
MRKSRNRVFHGLSIVVFAAMVLLLHRIFDFDRVCLEWDGLKQLQVGQEVVPACENLDRLHRVHVSEQIRSYTDRLNRLARLSWLTQKHSSVSVLVSQNNEVKNGAVSVDKALAQLPNHFERTVILTWVQRNWPEQEELTQEVMADLLTWSVLGASEWSDPLTGSVVSQNERLKFSLMPRTFETYCESPFRSAAEFEECDENPSQVEATALSLRPLISWTLWSYVDTLPAGNKIAFFRDLLSNHKDEPVSMLIPPSADIAPNTKPQEWAREAVKHLAKHWQSEQAFDELKLKHVLYHTELMGPVGFDLTVQVLNPELGAKTLESLRSWIGLSKKRRILYADGTQKIILPENLPTELEKDEIKTTQSVLIACDWPKAKDVLNPETVRMSAYKACSEESLPSWTEVFTSAQSLNVPSRKHLLAQ